MNHDIVVLPDAAKPALAVGPGGSSSSTEPQPLRLLHEHGPVMPIVSILHRQPVSGRFKSQHHRRTTIAAFWSHPHCTDEGDVLSPTPSSPQTADNLGKDTSLCVLPKSSQVGLRACVYGVDGTGNQVGRGQAEGWRR